MPNAKQGSCRCHFLKSFGMTQQGAPLMKARLQTFTPFDESSTASCTYWRRYYNSAGKRNCILARTAKQATTASPIVQYLPTLKTLQCSRTLVACRRFVFFWKNRSRYFWTLWKTLPWNCWLLFEFRQDWCSAYYFDLGRCYCSKTSFLSIRCSQVLNFWLRPTVREWRI